MRPNADDEDWIIRFVTDGRSRKASETRRSGRANLIFQNDGDDAFVLLSGVTRLLQGEPALRAHWKDTYSTYFPSRTDRANAAFIQLAAQRMDLWIRGITSEPFGLRPAVLERNPGSPWHVAPDTRAPEDD